MILPDKKKAAMLIVSRMGKDGSSKEHEQKPESSLSDRDEALKVIAEDMLQAFSDKSAMDLVMCLKAFLAEYENASNDDSD